MTVIRLYIVILFTTFSLLLSGQKKEQNTHFIYGAKCGINYSLLDQYNGNYGTLPLSGFYLITPEYKKVSLQSSIVLSFRKTEARFPFHKILNTHIDLELFPKVYITRDLYVFAGCSYSYLLDAKEIYYSNSGKYDIPGNGNSGLNFISGIGFKLEDNVNLEFNRNFISSSVYQSNYQLTLNFPINHRVNKSNDLNDKKQISKDHIQNLKNGILLVRLRSFARSAELLRQAGKNKKAEKIEEQIKNINQKIIDAFRKNFDFCRVEFFFSEASSQINNMPQNIFLNNRSVVDPSITINPDQQIYIAEFCNIEQDTACFFSHYSYEPNGNWSCTQLENYYGGSDLTITALVIKDKQFNQLHHPFPFYTKSMIHSLNKHPEQGFIIPKGLLLLQNLSYNKTVLKMNRKLHRFYNKNH